MLRGGDYACLVQRAGSTARRGIEVEPRLLDLSKQSRTGSNDQSPHIFSKCNAQAHDDMTF